MLTCDYIPSFIHVIVAQLQMYLNERLHIWNQEPDQVSLRKCNIETPKNVFFFLIKGTDKKKN